MVFFTAVFLNGCSKEPDDYVAKVNDSYLSSKDLNLMMDTAYGHAYTENNFYRNEIIRNWIDKELLYQQALKKKILEQDDFRKIIDNSEKSLAGALLLKKITDEHPVVINPGELEEFYESKKEDFRLLKNTYLLNMAQFSDETMAIQFRSHVLQSDWQTAVNRYEKEALILQSKINSLEEEDEIYPAVLRSFLPELRTGEVSIVIRTESSIFTVAQVVEKYFAGTIPPFEAVKDIVEARYLAKEKQKFVNEYMKSLYADNKIEIKN